jgi:hypothetical protein
MANHPRKNLRATLFALAVQISASALGQAVLAQEHETARPPDIIVTVEVSREIEKWKEMRTQGGGGGGGEGIFGLWLPKTPSRAFERGERNAISEPSLLVSPTFYPILTVSVDPNEPEDWVVAINGTPYQAGASKFRVLAGSTTITVTRQGKPPCNATVSVTDSGPNGVTCKF